ncbi:MAG: hypothetical protein ABI186_08595 [Candidatus Elarobacter sp.]
MQRNHRKPRGNRFGEDVSECLLVRRKHEYVGALIERSYVFALEWAGEPNVVLHVELDGGRARPRGLRSAASYFESKAAAREKRPRSVHRAIVRARECPESHSVGRGKKR